MNFKNRHWCDLNYNKWGKDQPDCAIRSICAAIGFDYEEACKQLGVKCIPGQGYMNDYGIDLDVLHDAFHDYLGEIEDNLDNDEYDSPLVAFLNGQILNKWLDESVQKGRTGIYLVYLDDNMKNDGGHIVCCKITSEKQYFIDTSNVGLMPVQAWIKVTRKLNVHDFRHWRYDKNQKKFA